MPLKSLTRSVAVLSFSLLLLLAALARPALAQSDDCQGRTKTASVGRSKSTSGTRVVLAACRGSARGISPSLLHGVLNVAEQRTEQSYPGSVGG